MIKDFFRQHWIAFVLAVVVGIIYIAPNIFFILSLGDEYKGIPMMQSANEESYLARIQEVVDGHPMLGSPFFYEYKDEWPLTPPTGELLYAIPSVLFNISPVNVIIASRFFLPFILFLLVYYLIYQLTTGVSVSRKINAVAGALLVTLGYDLVDYRSIIAFFTDGQALAGNFLLWARPVNPILGAIFLMSFLIFILQIIQKTKKQKISIAEASLFLALMIGSYFFSWGMALSILAMFVLIYSFKKEYQTVKKFFFVVFGASMLVSPYWYIVWQASKSPWYEDSVLRSGLFLTHYPLLNKLVLVTLVAFVLLVLFQFLKHKKAQKDKIAHTICFQLEDWHWFSLALILGSLWAYSQQIITGQTVWPYHFVQYSIPLMMIVGIVLLYNIVKKESIYLWGAGIFVIVSASASLGVYTQASVYRNDESHEYYRHLQSYAPLFDELNRKEKDCVVLVLESGEESKMLNFMIPAFTHCNRYVSTEAFSLLPEERRLYNYLTTIRLKGISSDTIEEYLEENYEEAKGYLASNWLGIYGYPANDFPDFSDPVLEKRLKEFPSKYRQFVVQDFFEILNKYRLDYILSMSSLSENTLNKFGGSRLIFSTDSIFLYKFTAK